METLPDQNIHPVDVTLAASEGISLRSRSFSELELTTRLRTLTEEPLLTEPAARRSMILILGSLTQKD